MVGALLEVELRKICAMPARAIDFGSQNHSKSLKTDGLGTFLEVQKWFSRGRRMQAQRFRHVAKYVAGAGVRQGCKNIGGRGGFEEGLKRCVSGGRRKDFVLCDVDV